MAAAGAFLLNTRRFELTDEDFNVQLQRGYAQCRELDGEMWGCFVIKNTHHVEYDAKQAYMKRQTIRREVQRYTEARENIFMAEVSPEGAAPVAQDDTKWPRLASDIPDGGDYAENCVAKFRYFTNRLADRPRVYQPDGDSVGDMMFLCRNVPPAANMVNHQSLVDVLFLTDPTRLSGIVTTHGIASEAWTAFQMHCEDSRLGAVNYVQQADAMFRATKKKPAEQPGGKMLLVVPPVQGALVLQMMQDAHEALVDSCHNCNSILQQKLFFFRLEELEKRGIRYHCVIVRPGECIVLRPGAAHQGGNTSSGISVAKNFLLAEDLPYVLQQAAPCVCKHKIDAELAAGGPVQLGDRFGVCPCRTVRPRLSPCPDANYVVDLRGLVAAVLDNDQQLTPNLDAYMAGNLVLENGERAQPPINPTPLTPDEIQNVRAVVRHMDPVNRDPGHEETMTHLSSDDYCGFSFDLLH